MNKDEIIKFLDEEKPITGKELFEKSNIDELSLWRICHDTDVISSIIVGKRYLRLDREVHGYARLSPSIKREFLTYTVCGLAKDSEEIEKKAQFLLKRIKEISRRKYNLAENICREILENIKENEEIKDHVCFILGGDIVFQMAHCEPRPEKSTGELVRGSDLDIVLVADNKVPKKLLEKLDNDIYNEKYRYLINPDYREEIDYVVKDIKKTEEQLKFDSFESMIACKILHEGKFMYGSKELFEKIKKMLSENKIPDKLDELEKHAIENRKNAESYLLNKKGTLLEEEYMKLFYTEEEAEEIF